MECIYESNMRQEVVPGPAKMIETDDVDLEFEMLRELVQATHLPVALKPCQTKASNWVHGPDTDPVTDDGPGVACCIQGGLGGGT